MSREDDFDPSFSLEGTDEEGGNTNTFEEVETHQPKTSISKKAAKKRDARRRIEDYLELRRVKKAIEDCGNQDVSLESWNWYEEEATTSNKQANKNK